MIHRTLQCLLAEHGFTDQPVGGCPAGSAEAASTAEVTEIVQTVVAELQKWGMIEIYRT